MSPRVLRPLFCTLFIGVLGLYLLAFMPVGWPFVGAVAVLSTFGILFLHFLSATVRGYSSATVFKALLSLLIGLGVTTFLSICCQYLFRDVCVPHALTASLHFMLPFLFTTISFRGLAVFPLPGGDGQCADGQSQAGEPGSAPSQRKYLLDLYSLEDGRVVELARTGLFDGQILLPTFLPRELKSLAENGDEVTKARAKKALDTLRRLECLPHVSLLAKDFRLQEATMELGEKLVHAAKEANAILITNELSALKSEADCGLYLAIDSIANALRPPIPKGEVLSIKIQRLGKEPKQGIGYLEDGTMVVVNGGGDFLGRMVKTQVLSQKYSSSGKIVFCNVRDDSLEEQRVNPYCQADASYCQAVDTSVR